MPDFHFSPRPNRAAEIHWMEWGDDAFRRALAEDKVILLSIGASWCHWCHVMDETSYSDDEIIHMINERFVPIRVDSDARPDVNRRYNLGGWPTTAFLTPDGEVMTGGTYVPADLLREVLAQVADTFSENREEVRARVAQIQSDRAPALAERAQARGELSEAIVDRVLSSASENFDALYGGVGDKTKFPHWEVFELALAQSFRTGAPDYAAMVEITLDRVLQSGVCDPVAGGFFRYSTTRDWSRPHYEKMLEDNARWILLLAHAAQVRPRELYLRRLRETVDYVCRTLHDKEADGFFGSQDADAEYYALGAEARAAMRAPAVDHTLYANGNAAMACAVIEAGYALNDAEIRSMGRGALARLTAEMYTREGGMHHLLRAGAGTPEMPGLLADQVGTAQGLVLAYETTGRNTYLYRACALAQFILDRFEDKENGGFYCEIPGRREPGLVRLPEKEMSENAAAARVLIQLAHLVGEDGFRTAAQRALEFFVPDYESQEYLAADFALSVAQFLREPLRVAIVGPHQAPEGQALIDAAMAVYAPGKLVQWLDPVRDASRLAALGYPPNTEGGVAYVCVGAKCLAPVRAPEELRAAIIEARGGARDENP